MRIISIKHPKFTIRGWLGYSVAIIIYKGSFLLGSSSKTEHVILEVVHGRVKIWLVFAARIQVFELTLKISAYRVKSLGWGHAVRIYPALEYCSRLRFDHIWWITPNVEAENESCLRRPESFAI